MSNPFPIQINVRTDAGVGIDDVTIIESPLTLENMDANFLNLKKGIESTVYKGTAPIPEIEVSGGLWFNTTDESLYRYDVDSSSWVEMI